MRRRRRRGCGWTLSVPLDVGDPSEGVPHALAQKPLLLLLVLFLLLLGFASSLLDRFRAFFLFLFLA